MMEANGGLMMLAPELWIQIFKQVATLDEEVVEWQEASTDYLGLKSLSLCCHYFYNLAAPIIHKTIILNHENDHGQPLLELLAEAESNAITRHVRAIIVQGHETDTFPKHLMELLDRLRGKADLREVRWEFREERIQDRFLECLHKYWPTCRLHVRVNSWYMTPELRFKNALHLIYGSPSLVSLDYAWPSRCDATLRSESDNGHVIPPNPVQVKALIDSCRDYLENLKLSVDAITSRSKYVDTFMLSPKDRLPALKELELHSIYLAPGQGLLWSQCADWGGLRHLALDIDGPQEFIQHFTGCVLKLSSFEIRIKSPNDEKAIVNPIHAFIRHIKKLKRFVSYNVPKSILPALAAHHGTSLQCLDFRILVPTMDLYGNIEDNSETPFPRIYIGNIVPEEENRGSRYRYPPFEEFLFCLSDQECYSSDEMHRHLHDEDIQYIQESFPNIDSFAFDLDPRGCLTYELLAPFSRHGNLQHLEIHLPLNVRPDIPHFQKEDAVVGAIKLAFNYIINDQIENPVTGCFATSRRQSKLKSLSIANEHWDRLDSPYCTTGMERMYSCRRLADGQLGEVVRYPVDKPYHGFLSGDALFGSEISNSDDGSSGSEDGEV